MDMLWMVWSVFASVSTVAQAGPALQVVRFDGNREVATATLQTAAQRVGPALSDDDGPERVALAVTEVYFDNGYVTARVEEPVRASDGALVVHVSEGARFYVRAISFSGGWPRAAAELRASLRTRAGDAFSRARVVADVERLASRVNGTVTPLTQLDVEHHAVDLELALVH
jgi:hemolysin activation/secretion protein